jgi:hypothetical protein
MKLESASRVGGPPLGSAVVAAGLYVGIGPDGMPAGWRRGDRSTRAPGQSRHPMEVAEPSLVGIGPITA